MRERLPFQIPEFVRTVWVSDAARAYWEPKIQAVNRVWPLVERATLVHGLRSGVLQTLAPETLPDLQQWCVLMGIPMLIVGMEGSSAISYGTASLPYRPGAPFTYRVYFGASPETFLTAWARSDNIEIGEALGFPDCCGQFFDHYWREQGWRDLTYPAMTDEADVPNQTYNHVLLKPLGVRPVFHLPCSLTCQQTLRLGQRIAALMPKLGYADEAAWAKTLLSMPMEWTSLHGVAMVVTPIFKLVYASDPLPTKVTLRLLSAQHPEHSARGNSFPFLTTTPMHLMPKRYLNGFSTLDTMQRAHRFILDALPPTLSGRVLDLGCGDGALLQTIHARYPETTLHGVEYQHGILPRGGSLADSYEVGDLFQWRWDRSYRLVLLAMQRLVEVDTLRAVALLDQIAVHAEQFVLYSYDGWRDDVNALLTRFSTVVRAREAKFEVCSLIPVKETV